MSIDCTTPRELTFQVGNLTLSAQAWGNPDGLPVIALHGWLDNSASFFRLAPMLKNAYVVALDMAGHGLSDHRGKMSPYNIWEDVSEIFSVADQLGWPRFALLGHSRGAIISTLCAGTFPDRISHVALIDGMLAQPVPAEKAAEQLAQSILDCRKPKLWPAYEALDTMVALRQKGVWPMSHTAAKALTQRGTIKTKQGFRWSADPLLKTASAMKLTAEQQQSFVNRITAPIQVFKAKQGALVASQQFQAKLAQPCEPHEVEGFHHCHMEPQANQIATILNVFFTANEL